MLKRIIFYVIVFFMLIVSFIVRADKHDRYKKDEGYNINRTVFNYAPKKEEPSQTENPKESDEQQYLDFDNLERINPDVVGWIEIPGTKINYPVVQSADNDEYLHTGFDKKENVAGSIFLDYESDSTFSGKNNIIYGHNMKNGTMFRDLLLFKEQDFFKEYSHFTLYTPERTIKLKAISCFYGKADTQVRRTSFSSQEEFETYVKRMIGHCSFAEYPEEPVKAIYTLVTCSYEIDDARTYLIAIEE